MIPLRSIHFDLKSIQHLRVINFNYFNAGNNLNIKNEAQKSLENKICNHVSLKYYVDIAFGIEEAWKGHPIEDTRIINSGLAKFSKEEKLTDISLIDWPACLVFTSAPDDPADRRIREELSKDILLKNNNAVGVKVQSRRAYKRIYFSQKEFSEGEKDNWGNLCLLLFQVRSEVQSKLVEDPDLFRGVSQDFNPISWSLLVGDIDGFVLYSSDVNRVKQGIEERVKNNKINLDNFFSLIIPNRIYSVSVANAFYNIEANYKEVWQSIGFKDFNEWKKLCNQEKL